MEQPPSSITTSPDLDWTVIATNLDAIAAASHLESRHPLFLTATAMEILFLVTFPACTTIIDANLVCAAIPESAIDRTASPELHLLITFLVYATIIDVVGTW
jgi:hypothetical protein